MGAAGGGDGGGGVVLEGGCVAKRVWGLDWASPSFAVRSIDAFAHAPAFFIRSAFRRAALEGFFRTLALCRFRAPLAKSHQGSFRSPVRRV